MDSNDSPKIPVQLYLPRKIWTGFCFPLGVGGWVLNLFRDLEPKRPQPKTNLRLKADGISSCIFLSFNVTIITLWTVWQNRFRISHPQVTTPPPPKRNKRSPIKIVKITRLKVIRMLGSTIFWCGPLFLDHPPHPRAYIIIHMHVLILLEVCMGGKLSHG